jgi:hypothetical protein
MMETEESSETLVFISTLTRLIAKEDFGAFWCLTKHYSYLISER